MPLPICKFSEQVVAATKFVEDHWRRKPKFGIVLGTGAGQLAEEIECEREIDYAAIPFFPKSTAMGHKGRFVCGQLAGQDVIAMQGRFHLYEGYPIEQATLPIHVMHRLGVDSVFISNASGGINPNFSSADIMVIESHIDLMCRTSPHLVGDVQFGRPLVRSDVFDRELNEQAMDCGRKNGFTVHQGVYAAMLGPNYETRAEYRLLRRIGGDVVGMSTVPEVTVAARYKMRVLGLSIITNVAKPDVLESTSGQQVINAAEIAAPRLKTIVKNAIENA